MHVMYNKFRILIKLNIPYYFCRFAIIFCFLVDVCVFLIYFMYRFNLFIQKCMYFHSEVYINKNFTNFRINFLSTQENTLKLGSLKGSEFNEFLSIILTWKVFILIHFFGAHVERIITCWPSCFSRLSENVQSVTSIYLKLLRK